jgi:hypothetical protein
MKNHVMLFEEFISNPAEEAALKRQFATSNFVASVQTTHSVSQIKSDETGIKTAIGNQDGNPGMNIPLATYKQDN